jgi:uroporphyrinogen decarboxylase
MTSRELILAAINGTPHPRVPVAQHNFAFCVRQAGITMDAYRRDPELAARALVAAAEEFGYDCIIIDFDTCSLAETMGAALDFPEDDMARVAATTLNSIADIRKLPLPDPHKDGRLPLWLETTRAVRRMVGDRLAIMARADQGPFGLLFQLRGHESFMMDLLDEEEEAAILDALEYCAEAGARFARAQMDAGADLTSIGDSACGQSLISPAHHMKFGRPYQAKYRKRMGDGVLSLHICGKTNDIIEAMATTGCEVLELDHLNDIVRSIDQVAGRACIFGNIDPALLSLGTPDDVLAACQPVLEAAVARTSRLVLCPGCLANADVPAANIRAMTDAAHRWGHYPA